MATLYPTAVDSPSNPSATNKLSSPSHSEQHANANDAIEAIENKLGIGASNQTPANNRFLVGKGAGESDWSKAVPTGEVVGTTDSQVLTNKTLNSPAISNPSGLNKTDVGLSQVDNTSDATKNSATANLENKTMVAPLYRGNISGWISRAETASVVTGYNKGSKSHEVRIENVDLRGAISPGARFKVTRSTAAPTQCADLEKSSSHYASRASANVAGMTFTDDFTVEAWIKVESYTGLLTIASRSNGTSGWIFFLDTDSGKLVLRGYNGSLSNRRGVISNNPMPLGRWIHVAATINMSANTGTIWVDGAQVSVTAQSAGTNPTALVQAGNLEIGSYNASNFFDGKVADVRIWSTIRTATQIRDNMNQLPAGNESGLISAFPLNGNFNDLNTTNANNLTAQNSAAATDADNMFHDDEMGIITKVDYSNPHTILTVYTGTDYSIPNMTLNNPQYALVKAPAGFPLAPAKWTIEEIDFTNIAATVTSTLTSIGLTMEVPLGRWRVGLKAFLTIDTTSANARYFELTASSDGSTKTNPATGGYTGLESLSATQAAVFGSADGWDDNVDLSAPATFTALGRTNSTAGVNNMSVRGDINTTILKAICAYL